MSAKILVYVPMLRMYGRCLQSILRLRWPETQLDIVFAKGGEDESLTRFERVSAKYEAGRRLCLAGGYEAMVTIEDDMIVPADALERMWETGADVAYGLYVWRKSNKHEWNAYTEVTSGHGVSLIADARAAKAAWGTVVEVAGIGNGCTLIRRPALEAIPFKVHAAACCDWNLALEAQRLGIRQVCDLGVVCGHMTSESEAQVAFPMVTGIAGPPRIFWPDPDTEDLGQLYRVEYL